MQNEEMDGSFTWSISTPCTTDNLPSANVTVGLCLLMKPAFPCAGKRLQSERRLSQSKPLPEGVESEVLRLTRAAVKKVFGALSG